LIRESLLIKVISFDGWKIAQTSYNMVSKEIYDGDFIFVPNSYRLYSFLVYIPWYGDCKYHFWQAELTKFLTDWICSKEAIFCISEMVKTVCLDSKIGIN